MYLLTLDQKTSLISEDVTGDNWKGIKTFCLLVDKYGIEALTVIAFTCDYLSPLKTYREQDRFFRAQIEVYGNRDTLDQNDELILNSITKYKELQYHPDIEYDKALKDNKIRLVNRYQKAVEEQDDVQISKYSSELNKFEETIKNHNSKFDSKIISKEAISNKGYVLSRIENDLLSRKNSKFQNPELDFKNPNKLGLESKI